jgi:hypothetical protein
MDRIINVNLLLKEPLNWIIVPLVIILAGMALALILPAEIRNGVTLPMNASPQMDPRQQNAINRAIVLGNSINMWLPIFHADVYQRARHDHQRSAAECWPRQKARCGNRVHGGAGRGGNADADGVGTGELFQQRHADRPEQSNPDQHDRLASARYRDREAAVGIWVGLYQ